MIEMYKSSRFIATVVSIIIFCIGTFFYNQEPMEFALALSVILGPYLIVKSYRGTKIN